MISNRLLDGRVRIRHLILVTTIAEAGTLVSAATALSVTQPFVSRGLQEIEKAVGVKLFERGPRGVKPTVEGEIFLEYAWVVLNTLRQAGEHLDQVNLASSGFVRVGENLAAAHLLLPRAIIKLKSSSPSITVSVIEEYQERLVTLLNRNEVDVLVGRLPKVRSARHRYLPLYDEPLKLVVRKGHPALEHAAELSELLDYPWVLPSSSSLFRPELDEMFTANGLPLPLNFIECSTVVTTRPILLMTDAIAPLPMLIGATDDDLEILPISLEMVPSQIGITVKRDALLNPAKARLISSLTSVAESVVMPLLASAQAQAEAEM